WLSRLHWVMRTSLLKTLAAKHKSTVTKMARRHKSLYYHNGRFNVCLMATAERPGKEPPIPRFGRRRLRPEFSATILDKATAPCSDRNAARTTASTLYATSATQKPNSAAFG